MSNKKQKWSKIISQWVVPVGSIAGLGTGGTIIGIKQSEMADIINRQHETVQRQHASDLKTLEDLHKVELKLEKEVAELEIGMMKANEAATASVMLTYDEIKKELNSIQLAIAKLEWEMGQG